MHKSLYAVNFELRPVKQLENYEFLVDHYQRGYKWSCQQALDLLNDIDEFSIEDRIYCLQPLVVKELESSSSDRPYFELIDGQQRMTTIFIILSVLPGYEPIFKIAYKTRIQSEQFLINIGRVPIADLDSGELNIAEDLEDSIGLAWLEFLDEGGQFAIDNVDNFHFYRVYQTIHLWFQERSKEDMDRFMVKLLHHTHVIWYEVLKGEISERVFININSGKIALTNAELIKALFLINIKDDSNKELSKIRQDEIAQEWDAIEYSLQDNSFWYFINEDPKDEQPTRIDFLFDVLKVKPKGHKDAYFSYRAYALDIKNGTGLVWSEVKDLFDRLEEWFENRKLYHLIGFIISQGFSTIPKLILLSKGKGKTAFEIELTKLIRKKFLSKKEETYPYFPENLHYEKTYAETLAVLLLFNIETYQKSDANYKFPFDRFKREKWSIEHIHAQAAGLFTTNKEVADWYQDMLHLIGDLEKVENYQQKDLDGLKAKLKPFAARTKEGDLSKNDIVKLSELSGDVASFLNMHKLENLALLDRNTNSAIGNKNFLDKREMILAIDKEGYAQVKDKKLPAFIPGCTKNAFLKYYTKENDKIQMSYWGYTDRVDYREAIVNLLNIYYYE
jgi:hypothetical protein